MTDIDEAALIAWVDGELDEIARRRVDRAVAQDPALAERLDAHRRLRQRLGRHYEPVAQEPVPDALQVLLRSEARVVPLARSAPRWRAWAAGGAMAASLALGLGIGRIGARADGPVIIRDNAMVARGALASALDSQLAGAQADASIRIGLTFRRKGGGWCRSFEGAAVAGVACHEGPGNWQVQQLLPGDRDVAYYRQASSGDARMMATIDALRDGDPVDAAGEARARAEGWRS